MLVFWNVIEMRWYAIQKNAFGFAEFPQEEFIKIKERANYLKGACAALQKYWAESVEPSYKFGAADNETNRKFNGLWGFRKMNSMHMQQ